MPEVLPIQSNPSFISLQIDYDIKQSAATDVSSARTTNQDNLSPEVNKNACEIFLDKTGSILQRSFQAIFCGCSLLFCCPAAICGLLCWKCSPEEKYKSKNNNALLDGVIVNGNKLTDIVIHKIDFNKNGNIKNLYSRENPEPQDLHRE